MSLLSREIDDQVTGSQEFHTPTVPKDGQSLAASHIVATIGSHTFLQCRGHEQQHRVDRTSNLNMLLGVLRTCPLGAAVDQCGNSWCGNFTNVETWSVSLLGDCRQALKCAVGRRFLHSSTRVNFYLKLAATLRWLTAGGAIRIALRQLSQSKVK